jgi:hypothetical protein
MNIDELIKAENHPIVIASEAKQSRNYPKIDGIAAALRASQ